MHKSGASLPVPVMRPESTIKFMSQTHPIIWARFRSKWSPRRKNNNISFDPKELTRGNHVGSTDDRWCKCHFKNGLQFHLARLPPASIQLKCPCAMIFAYGFAWKYGTLKIWPLIIITIHPIKMAILGALPHSQTHPYGCEHWIK